MTKPKIDYVISALGWGVFPNGLLEYEYKKDFGDLLVNITKKFREDTKKRCQNYDSDVSILFNAFTEKNNIDLLTQMNRGGFDTVFADSGGLQIITVGKTINEEMKRKVYQVQSYAEYALCFDEIPIKSITRSRVNERTNIGGKLFDPDILESCGVQTGKNVAEQIKIFKDMGAQTKVILIVQGNDADTMVEFYKYLTDQLTEEDYKYVGGLAITKTTMGNGVLQGIETVRAGKKIAGVCHPSVKKLFHILGVGAVSRMRPYIYLLKSGYFSDYEKVSYDSSSHSHTYDTGLLKIDGHCSALGNKIKTQKGLEHWQKVYNLFKDNLEKYITFEQFINGLYGEEGNWHFSAVRQRALKAEKNQGIVLMMVKALHTYYQIDNFTSCIDKMFEEKKFQLFNSQKNRKLNNSDIALGELLKVKDDYDLEKWINHNKTGVSDRHISSTKDYNSLEGLFEE